MASKEGMACRTEILRREGKEGANVDFSGERSDARREICGGGAICSEEGMDCLVEILKKEGKEGVDTDFSGERNAT